MCMIEMGMCNHYYDNDYFKVKKLLSKYPENWTYLLYHIGRKALYKILAPKKVTAIT